MKQTVFLMGLSAAATAWGQLGPCTLETIAGGGAAARGDGGPAVEAELFGPRDMILGPDGALYISDSGHHRIRRVLPDGVIETFAGTGVDEISGDGGAALQAGLASPRSMTFAPDGSLYFLDFDDSDDFSSLRRISPDGVISTVAGDPASGTVLQGALEIAAAPDGSIYVATPAIDRLLRVTAAGEVEILAGAGEQGSFLEDGVPAREARLFRPETVAVDPAGIAYMIEDRGALVRRILADGSIETYLDAQGSSEADGTAREEVRFLTRGGFGVDALGRLYWRDDIGIRRIGLDDRLETVWLADRARSTTSFTVASDATIFRRRLDQVFRVISETEDELVAGLPRDALTSGDGGPPLEAALRGPTGLAVGPGGEIYLGDSNRVRVIRDGSIEPFAGNGAFGPPVAGPALDTGLSSVVDVAADQDGNVYIADSRVVYRVSPDGMLSRFAGNSRSCRDRVCGETGPALDAALGVIRNIEVDRAGTLYIRHTDRERNARIRKIGADGIVTTLRDSDNSILRAASLGLDADNGLLAGGGSAFGADAPYWRISAEGEVAAIDGLAGFVSRAEELTADAAGNVYLTDRNTNIRRLTPEGHLSSLVLPGFEPLEGMAAGEANFGFIRDLDIDAQGNLIVVDRRTGVVRLNQPGACAVVERPRMAVTGLLNGASFQGSLAPGAIVSTFGADLGPAEGAGARIEAGRLTTELAGVRLIVDGRESPMIFASSGQGNAILPHQTRFNSDASEADLLKPFVFSEVWVEVNGVRSESRSEPVLAAAPALFAQSPELAAALNEDGSLNGPVNPAAPGSVIVLFGTGAGVTDPPSVDGEITGTVLPRPVLPVEVMFGDHSAEILYAGAAPGLVAGVLQVNARIAVDQPTTGVTQAILKVGSYDNTRQRINVVIGR